LTTSGRCVRALRRGQWGSLGRILWDPRRAPGAGRGHHEGVENAEPVDLVLEELVVQVPAEPVLVGHGARGPRPSALDQTAEDTSGVVWDFVRGYHTGPPDRPGLPGVAGDASGLPEMLAHDTEYVKYSSPPSGDINPGPASLSTRGGGFGERRAWRNMRELCGENAGKCEIVQK